MTVESYTDLEFRDVDFAMPPKLADPGVPATLDDYNQELIRIENALGQAADYHLRYSLLKAKHVGQYQTEYDFHYAKSAGLDFDRPVFIQRQGQKRGQAGTIAEHEAYARHQLGKLGEQMMTVEALIKAWAIRLDALMHQLSAFQSAANNERKQWDAQAAQQSDRWTKREREEAEPEPDYSGRYEPEF